MPLLNNTQPFWFATLVMQGKRLIYKDELALLHNKSNKHVFRYLQQHYST